MSHKPDNRLVGYIRVSAREQNLNLQMDAMRKAGVMEDNLHFDKKSGVSAKREGLKYALLDLREGDTFVIWKLDRLARSVPKLYEVLAHVLEKGCGFRSLTENIDIATAVGRLMFGILGSFAQFERDLIAERTAAGLAALKQRQGKQWKWGRKLYMTPQRIKRLGALLNSGKSGPEVAKIMKISTASVYAHWKQAGPGKFVRKRKHGKA